MGPRRRETEDRLRRLSVLVALPLLVMITAGVAQAATLRTGCQRSRPALAYRVGVRHPVKAAKAMMPCLAVVNERTSESADVGVLRSGTVLYAPLVDNDYPAPADDRGPAEIAASANGGTTWHNIVPGDTNHILDVPPWMSVDPHTQRIWFATVLPDLCGAEISWSDDAGKTWQTNPLVGCPAMGSESVLEGSAPSGGAQPTGYAHVVYYCANASDLSTSQLFCYRSLDGGRSFASTASNPDPPPKPGCNTQHPARPGAVGKEGYLYFPVFQCGQLSMAVSHDEGATWHLIPIGTENVVDLYTTSVAVDAAGNVYLAWIQGSSGGGQSSRPAGGGPNPTTEAITGAGVPFLSVSRDHGAHWSAPVDVGPRQVRNAQTIAIAARGRGEVGISYLANADGGKLLDGWLSQTADALTPHALWWAAPANDPRTPLINSADSTSFGNRLFFNTDTFAPNGELWGAFHCAFTAACPNQRIGVVGRLTTRPPARRHKHHRKAAH